MKRFFLALAIFLLFSSQASALWFDSDWKFKRAVELPNQDLNKYMVIKVDVNFADLNVIADMNDLIVVDENRQMEVWRVFDGNYQTEDGNLYFPLTNQFSTGDSTFGTTYYMYYGNSDPPNKDFNILSARANIAAFETGTLEGWTPTNTPTIDSSGKLEGTYSINTDDDGSADTIRRWGITSLNDSNNDVNYSVLFQTSDSSIEHYNFQIYRRANDRVQCEISVKSGTFRYHNGAGETDSGYPVLNNETFRFDIKYVDNAPTCFYTIFQTDGNVFLTVEGSVLGPSFAPAVPDEIVLSSSAAAKDGFYDNAPFEPAIVAVALGGETTPAVKIVSIESFLDSGEYPIFFFATDGNLTIDFNVINVDNNRLFADINYSTSATFGTGTPIVDDLNLTTGSCNTSVWNVVPGVCSWDWNIFGVSDFNYYILIDINAGNNPDGSYYRENTTTSKTLRIGSSESRFTFLDENTYVPLTGLTVSLNGSSYTTNASGFVDININTLDEGVHTIRAFEDGNYGIRFFEIDVNTENIALTYYMLRDSNGIDFNMLFYDTDKITVLADTRVYVYKGDHNVAGVVTTDALGQVDFFLNPDANYYFKPGDRRYDKVKVTFKIPLDEALLTNVTPYNLTVSNLIQRSFVFQSVAQELHLFPNTLENYKFDLNAGEDYYERKLLVNYRGNPQTADVQMYLVKIVDGVSSVFFTRDATDLKTIPNIRIEVFKTIIGVGTVEVQSAITDGAGTATLTFIIDNEYRLDFYDELGAFIFSTTLRPNFATYYAYLDLGEIAWDAEITQEFITIIINQKEGFFVFDEDGFDFNVTVDVNDGSILNSWLTVADEDGNLTFNTSCGNACGYHLVETDLNGTQQINVVVYVETSSGLTQKKTYSFIPVHKNSFNLVLNLQSGAFREQFGCSADPNEPCFFLLIVAAFLTIAGLIGVGAGITTDTSALGIVAMGFLGIFTYLTWIPTGFFILACLAAFASIILSRRGF